MPVTLLTVFDVDGTLIRSVAPSSRIFSSALGRLSPLAYREKKLAEKYFFSTQGLPLVKQYATIIRHINSQRGGINQLPEDREFIQMVIGSYYEMKYSRSFPLYADVIPCLECLGRSKDPVFVNCASTSMKEDYLQRVFRDHGLMSYFSMLLGKSRKVGDKRMHRNIIREAFRLNEADFTERTSLVGDSLHDMTIAHEWGVYPVYCARRYRHGASTMRDAETHLANLDIQDFAVISSLKGLHPKLVERYKQGILKA